MYKGHALTKVKQPVLRDLVDTPFVWFPRRQSPFFYDRLMHECFRGGLKAPHIVQEALDTATMVSLVSCGLGAAFVNEATRWRCPKNVVLLSMSHLNLSIPFALVWRKDNVSALLANFVAAVRLLPEVLALARIEFCQRACAWFDRERRWQRYTTKSNVNVSNTIYRRPHATASSNGSARSTRGWRHYGAWAQKTRGRCPRNCLDITH